MTVTPELILVTLISVAIQFLYFVGFWTSGARATPGMRGLRMQVVDAATGSGMSLVAATKRFIALGAPLALLILVPALQSAAGIAQFALSLFLFFTAITNDRRQGLHDKWANSLVIRSTTSGDGAVVIGCLVLVVIADRVGDHPVRRGVCRDGPGDRGADSRDGAGQLSEDERARARQRDPAAA